MFFDFLSDVLVDFSCSRSFAWTFKLDHLSLNSDDTRDYDLWLRLVPWLKGLSPGARQRNAHLFNTALLNL